MLTAIGNVLDLPGSMARDALMLRNPLDQLLDPFSQEGRTSGQDILDNFGLQDSPWLSLALEMGLDPTTYVGYGALSKGAKGLGLVSKGASGVKTAGRAAKAIGRAIRHPQNTIDWLAEMPSKLKGREGEILGGIRARFEDAYAGVKARFTSPVTETKAAMDEALKAGAAPASQAAAQAATSLGAPSTLDELMSGQYMSNVADASKSHYASKLVDMKDLLAMRRRGYNEKAASKMQKWLERTEGDVTRSTKESRMGRYKKTIRGMMQRREQDMARDMFEKYVAPNINQAPPATVAEALNQQVAESALGRARKGFNFAGIADRTIYNPDVLRMALGGMAINSAAAGRAQNPTSHAYMGYYE